jgi:hypothetical protein
MFLGSQTDAARRRNRGDLPVQALALHKDLSTETVGPPAAVIADLDSVGLQSLAITAGTHPGMMMLPSRMVDVEFYALHEVAKDRDVWFAGVTLSRRSGATLHVHGSDPAWVRSTFNEAKTELAKGVPWWRLLRSGNAWGFYALLSAGAVAIGIQPWLKDLRWWWAGTSVAAGLVLGTMVFVLARHLLPGFEVLTSGSRGRALSVLSVLGALLAQLVIGVVVNLVTT